MAWMRSLHFGRILSLLPVLALLAGVADGCGDRAPSGPPPEPQAASEPSLGAQPPRPAPAARKGWVGVIISRESVDVTAESPGRLSAVYVQIGDTVHPGDRIASLDTRLAQQDLEMARSSLRAAEADAERAEAEMKEARARHERRQANPDFFSKEDLAEAELRARTATSALEVSQARVSEQRARVRQLQTTLGQTEIRAPFAGRVAERFVDPGALVGPGTSIARLISGGDLMVRAAVPPEEARRLSAGSRVTARVRDLGIAVPGRIERIAPEVDTASQMVFVEARLEPTPEMQGRLQTGLVVDLLTP
jgi:RND family efflux transporter MFP subunit